MARNLGREYASMTEEERRQFELKRAGDEASEEELDLDDPRRYPPSKSPSDGRERQGA
jgi:hypothetical protein